jgi:hypothetical protein
MRNWNQVNPFTHSQRLPGKPCHSATPGKPVERGVKKARKTLASRGKISMLQPETGLVALDAHVRQGRKAQEYQERQL